MSRAGRLWVVLGANLGLVAVLLIVGLAAHSIGVWAEGVDSLADAAAVGVSIAALARQRRRAVAAPGAEPSRAPRLAAALNAGWLLVLCAIVCVLSLTRLSGPVRGVDGLPVLVTSAVAALVMLGCALLLGGDDDHDDDADGHGALALAAVLLDTAADAAAAAGVALAGAIILLTHSLDWLDPAVALAIALVVGAHALRLLARIRAAAPAPG